MDKENFELYLLRYCEGTLTERERADVERSLAENPEWRELVAFYQDSPRLSSAEPAPYARRERLVDGGMRRRRMLVLWPSVAAAACVVLVAGSMLWHFHSPEPTVAQADEAVVPVQVPVLANDEEKAPPAMVAAVDAMPRQQVRPAGRQEVSPADDEVAEPEAVSVEDLIPVFSHETELVAENNDAASEDAGEPMEEIINSQEAVSPQEAVVTNQLITYIDDAPDGVEQLTRPYDIWAVRARSVASIVRRGSRAVRRSREHYQEQLDQFYGEENLDAENRMLARNLIGALFER